MCVCVCVFILIFHMVLAFVNALVGNMYFSISTTEAIRLFVSMLLLISKKHTGVDMSYKTLPIKHFKSPPISTYVLPSDLYWKFLFQCPLLQKNYPLTSAFSMNKWVSVLGVIVLLLWSHAILDSTFYNSLDNEECILQNDFFWSEAFTDCVF